MQIVAIGGGELKDRKTLEFDRFIVGLTGIRRPRALFIPTASGDSPSYCETFDRIYGRLLGCRIDSLRLVAHPVERAKAGEKILRADLIYVGGGNTLRMMRLWRKLGIDRLLKKAGANGSILSGLSAGAICWYEWGHSDSRAYSGKSGWSFIRVRGLGLIPGIFCPHLDSEHRHRPLCQMVLQTRTCATACDDLAAVHIKDGKASALTLGRHPRVCVYTACRGRISRTVCRQGDSVAVG